MKIRIISSNDVRSALPMAKAIEAMKEAFGQLSASRATMPLRTRLATEKGVSLLMPAYLHQTKKLGIKLVSVYEDNPQLNLPTVTATVLVLDPETGQVKALMDGNSLTAIRTGAGGGLAAQLLARQDAKIVALFGAGVQARSQLEAAIAVRPIEQVYLINRTPAKAQQLAAEIATWPHAPKVHIAVTPQEAIAKAEIIITATASSSPLFDGNEVAAGTHINAIGAYRPEMQEVDGVTVNKSRVVVDFREACLAEAGDLIIPQASIDAELGEIINGEKPGRQSEAEITLFKSVGVAVQDAVAAAAVLSEAETLGLGTLVEL